MRFWPLLLLCLLLSGCGREAPDPDTFSQPNPSPSGFYDPDSVLEAATGGALRAYPLGRSDVTWFRALGSGFLLLSGEKNTTLTVLTGETLQPTAELTLDFLLSPEDPSLAVADGLVTYYDPAHRETVVLDGALSPLERRKLPADIQGTPLLSPDRKTLYYCTYDAIRAWDLESGLRRCVKAQAYPAQTLTGIYQNGTVLGCRVTEGEESRLLFLSAKTGHLLTEQPGEIRLSESGSRYFANLPVGLSQRFLFGDTKESPRIFLPEDPESTCFFLESRAAAITAREGDGTSLFCYDLASGRRTAAVTLNSPPLAIRDSPQGAAILTLDEGYGCHTLYLWDLENRSTHISDTAQYTFSYLLSPNPSDLSDCRSLAARLSETYGIQIHVGNDALAAFPRDYDLTAELQPAVIRRELELLEKRLARFPRSILLDTAACFSSLHLCLVSQIADSAESGNRAPVSSALFFRDREAYAVIAAGALSEDSLHRELFHLMETRILAKSTALDQWEHSNPVGFSYSYSPSPDLSPLWDLSPAFLTAESLISPREDRAAVFAAALRPNNRAAFGSTLLQVKLRQICLGLREAYGLDGTGEPLPWEQYLALSLPSGK